MDKTLKREVLFDKKAHSGATQPPPKPPKKEVPKPKEEKKEQRVENQSEIIIRWLEKHDLIKIRALCTLVKLDPGNFHRWVNVKKELPADVIEKITPILKDYGFDDSL